MRPQLTNFTQLQGEQSIKDCQLRLDDFLGSLNKKPLNEQGSMFIFFTNNSKVIFRTEYRHRNPLVVHCFAALLLPAAVPGAGCRRR